MMNQGGITDTVTTLEPNSLERHAVDSSQGQASSYYPSSTGSEALSWTMYRGVNGSSENRVYSNSSFNHEQHVEPSSRNLQDGLTVQSATSTSSSGTANVSQDYSSYATYSSSNPYGYASTGYSGYYNGYQQQPNQSYPQPVGGYQSTGATHQPISSFQNTGSYAGSSSYSTTYYNPGDYQTSGSYTSGAYSNQTNLWQQGGYSSYTHQYPSYTPPDSNSAYSSSNAPTTSIQYEQQYKQWADYYSQTEVSCAPGTENISVASTSSLGGPGPGVASGYSAPNSQKPASFAPSSWRPESSSSELPLVQPSALTSDARDSYWKYGGQGVQNYHVSSLQQNLQKPLDLNPTLGSFQDQQKSEFHQGSNVQYQTIHQVVPSYQSSYHASLQTAPQTVTQTVPQIPQTVASKVQIPTNPRIASNLPLGFSKTDKDSTMSGMTKVMKPAYVSVSLPKPNDNESSHVAADSILKPGMFPRSLRGYVERALARCKDDTQMAACQAVMKEVITKATADGTLCTRDWDSEPLFALPNIDTINKESNLDSSTPVSALVKNRRSPSRRTKSRWEPLPEEKPIEKQSLFTTDNIRYGGAVHPSEKEKQFSSGKPENKENKFSNLKFYISNQKSANKNVLRPAKRQRLGEDLGSGSNGDSSSDSDKEQSLTEYYAGAITLADSPEERKRRESRSKRFEKNHGNRAANNLMGPKNLGAGNLYTRRATALVLSQNFEDGASRAVEDIDWDSLTVKGTCQEIEKRYLRLTSAPDPATVRPEEVLEKSLHMVQNSQKNYFYKCDQLKSIRQDLTVQRIRNELTAKVYETHARLAIEVGDLSEYNQCQSQLTTLYAEGIKGCHMEFSAYNLLCVILHSNNNRDLLSAMSRLSAEARKDEAVKHALAVRAAVTAGNYVLFFKLYKTGPNLNTCLMDLYVEKMRYAAVKCMSRSYRPTIPVPYVAQVLGFTTTYPMAEAPEEKDTGGLEECMEWLKAHGACVVADSSGEMMLDAKASVASLFMPEPEDAVAHGDASLAVNDFLTRTPT